MSFAITSLPFSEMYVYSSFVNMHLLCVLTEKKVMTRMCWSPLPNVCLDICCSHSSTFHFCTFSFHGGSIG